MCVCMILMWLLPSVHVCIWRWERRWISVCVSVHKYRFSNVCMFMTQYILLRKGNGVAVTLIAGFLLLSHPSLPLRLYYTFWVPTPLFSVTTAAPYTYTYTYTSTTLLSCQSFTPVKFCRYSVTSTIEWNPLKLLSGGCLLIFLNPNGISH